MILNSKRTQLLDHNRLAMQLCSLERRASRIGAKDAICHPPGGHNDCAAAVAGLMVRLVGRRNYQVESFHVPHVVSVPRSFDRPFVSAADIDTGSSVMPPGGWPAGSPGAAGLTGNLAWYPGKGR